MQPLVTIVIALYNKSKYIEKCIDSIVAQTFTDWQLIIVNDGSTDDGLERIESYAGDPRILIVNQTNNGPGRARNTGLYLAQSLYISFIDADDFWESTFLEKAINALTQHPTCDLWLCGALWDPLGERRKPFIDRESTENYLWNIQPDYSAKEIFQTVNLFATGAVVAKTEVIKKYHGYFSKERVTFGEDTYLWMQVIFNHTVYKENALLLVINTKSSELGIGRSSFKPIPPALLYPEDILRNCPAIYRNSLNEFFNLIAFQAFRREIYQGNISKAFKLLISYPGLSKYRDKGFLSIPFAMVVYPFKYYLKKIIK